VDLVAPDDFNSKRSFTSLKIENADPVVNRIEDNFGAGGRVAFAHEQNQAHDVATPVVDKLLFFRFSIYHVGLRIWFLVFLSGKSGGIELRMWKLAIQVRWSN
jgi:hypothetical protein